MCRMHFAAEWGNAASKSLANQLSDDLPRQPSVSKQGAMKFMRPLLDAGLIVKHGIAKTGSALERTQALVTAFRNIFKK